jgi:hypothetical protein
LAFFSFDKLFCFVFILFFFVGGVFCFQCCPLRPSLSHIVVSLLFISISTIYKGTNIF